MIHEGDIWIVPLNSENPTQIADTPENERWVDCSPDGKWLSYLTYEEFKVRPESTLWEADFEEILEKLQQ